MARLTKAHLICYILDTFGPLTRVAVMRHIHVLEHKKHRFVEWTNHEYFRPKRRYDGWMSPCALGFFSCVSTRDQAFVYGNTELGRIMAQMYRDHLGIVPARPFRPGGLRPECKSLMI